MFVQHRFILSDMSQDILRSMIPNFGYDGFGEFVFYRTYSRIREDGGQEDWADVVIRVTNGVISIRKDWYIKNRIHWDEKYWQAFAFKFSVSMFKMEWLPPGRGLWAMGSDFVYNRGSMALYNCAATELTTENFDDDIAWFMDSLMHGVGVGGEPLRDDKMELHEPIGTFDYEIPDSREGWCESVRLQLNAHLRRGQKKPIPHYDKVRGPNLPIKGFGGVSSGPGPLMDLHKRIENEVALFKTRPEYDSVYFKTNIANHTGCCVVAGNVRRSAELMKGKITDPTFPNLKNYEIYPEREAFGWMSNNSVALETDEDFMMLGEIAKRVIKNGEPGYINMRNLPRGRIGRRMGNLRKDKGTLLNPCGEIILESREVCNVDETYPTVCEGYKIWLKACEYAAFYCTTVSLLPTHQPSTNRVVARNRRIGVGMVDYTGWKYLEGVHRVTNYMREGYETVVSTACRLNDEAGVPHPIRFTTVKPGGTTPKLVGRTPGIGYPNFIETLRRIRVAKNSPVHPLLVEAGVPYEEDYFDKYTDVFEWPTLQGPAKPAAEVTIWEQAFNLVTVQREWADNAVSNTLNFKPMWPLIECIDSDFRNRLEMYIGVVAAVQLVNDPEMLTYNVPEKYKIKIKRNKDVIHEINVHTYDPNHEEDDIEPVLSAIAPLTKTVAVLPHSVKGAYRQMPEEGITEDEYLRRRNEISPIDWGKLSGSDGQDELYCSGPICEIPR